MFPPPRLRPGSLTDETIVCRCEEVTAGRLRAELADGLTSLPALKKATRAGMGRCQGRFCAATIARLCPDPPDDMAFAAPRAPVRPVPAAPLMFEAPEFEAPLLELPAPPAHLHKLPALSRETRRCDVLVIGGGLAGLCSAYFLAKDGVDVLLAERDEAGMAASTANAGSLHVQLLSYDFTDETPEDGGQAARTLPLAPRSIALWKEIAREAGEDLGIRTEGGLMLAEDAAGLAWLRRKSAMERRWGIESHVLGANELRALAPALSEHMVGADFVPAEGYGDPLRGTLTVLKLAQHAGARLLRGAEVQAIAREGAAWQVRTTKGTIIAGRVVNATGPWAGRIGRMVGLDLPVTGTVQQVIVTEPAPPLTKHLIALANRHLSLKQQASGGFLVGGGWFGGFDPASGRSHNLRRNIEGNLWVCARALPALRSLSFVRSWTGINPAIDRAPILGEAPGLPGFFNAVSANGYTLGPIIGRITADTVRGHAVDPELSGWSGSGSAAAKPEFSEHCAETVRDRLNEALGVLPMHVVLHTAVVTVTSVPCGSASRNLSAASAVRMRESAPRTRSTGRSNARASSSVMFSCGPAPRTTPSRRGIGVAFADELAVCPLQHVVLHGALDVLARAVGIAFLHVAHEMLQIVELLVVADEPGDDSAAAIRQLRPDIDDHQRAQQRLVASRQQHRVAPAHRVTHQDRPLQSQRGNERFRIQRHLVVGVGDVTRPLAGAVATLVECKNAEPLRQMHAGQVPGMRRLVSAMQQYDRRCIRRTPFQEVEPQLPQHDVAGPVWRGGDVREWPDRWRWRAASGTPLSASCPTARSCRRSDSDTWRFSCCLRYCPTNADHKATCTMSDQLSPGDRCVASHGSPHPVNHSTLGAFIVLCIARPTFDSVT